MSAATIDILGYVGGILVASSAPMQLYKSCKYQSTRDLAWSWVALYVSGISLIFVYGIMANLPPIWIPLCLELSSTILLLGLKVKLDIIDHVEYSKDVACQTGEDLEIVGMKGVELMPRTNAEIEQRKLL